MGSVRDIARLGKAVAKTDSSNADGLLWFLYIFGGIALLFILFNAWLNYRIKKRNR